MALDRSNPVMKAFWNGAGMEIKDVQVGDHEIVFAEGGRGDHVILVHGFGGDKLNWHSFAKQLTGQYHVIALDLPGFGESTRLPEASYGYPQQVERLHAFIQKLNLSKIHLAGNSMGGAICGIYAARHPEEVASLTLIDTAGVVEPQKSEFARLLRQGVNPLVVKEPEDYDRLLAFVAHTPQDIPEPFKTWLAQDAVARGPFNAQIFLQILEHFNLLERELENIKVPVLMIWGDSDRVIDPSCVQVLEQKIKDTRTVIIKDCGHMPMTEKPEETARAFLDFLQDSKDKQESQK